MEVASTIRSIFDKRKLFFGQALLRLVKSTNTLQFSLLGGRRQRWRANPGSDILNNVGLGELSHFVFYDFQAFWGKLSYLLKNWRIVRVGE